MAMNSIVIAGCGPGSRASVTAEVAEAVRRAEVLIGSARLLALFPEARAERVEVRGSADAACEAITQRVPLRSVVLVSGDPGLCSLARFIVARFGLERCRVLPGISSVQVACARLGFDWGKARIVHAHGAVPEESSSCFKQERLVVVLGGNAAAAAWVADLHEELGAGWSLFVLENLTLGDERVRQLDASALRHATLSALTVFVLTREESQ
jgi:precorrin-6y C5,15-methyltransferase (decarboxylating) CbiE subunit